jgi:hypothetical protein
MHRNHSFLLRLLVIVNLICWVQCLPSDAASPEKRVALVIGNSAYQNTPALPNPRNDATEIGKVLKRLGFEVDVQVDLTKSTLDKVLRQFGDRLEGAQVAVFYYAGHGIQVAGTNYLIPIDATLRKEKDLYFEVSELNLVLQQMEGAQRVNLVFLDACRDNPLSKKLAEGMGSGRSTLIGRGLAPMKASDGTMISYATKDGEVASDGKGKHSPYSQAILNHIEAPMEISQMLRKVREDVKKITDNRQTPWEYGSLTGDFYFTGPIKVEISQEPTKSDSKSKMEALYWQSIMNDNDPAVFESYLKKYPDGEFSDLAKIKISNLKKGQKNELLPSLAQTVQPAVLQPNIGAVKSDEVTGNKLTSGFAETFSGNGVDSSRWGQWDNDAKPERQYGNGLIISGGAKDKVLSGIDSKFYLTGDFDVEVSYEIIKWPFNENPELDRHRCANVHLFVHNGKKGSNRYCVSVERYNGNKSIFEGYAIAWVIKGELQFDPQPKITTHEKGKLRLKRENREIQSYFDEGGSWKLMSEIPATFDMPLKIGLGMYNFSSKNNVVPTEVEVRFTNLKINLN